MNISNKVIIVGYLWEHLQTLLIMPEGKGQVGHYECGGA